MVRVEVGMTEPAPKTPVEAESTTPPKKRRLWRWVLGGGFMLLVLVVALLPQILSTASIKQELTKAFMAEYQGSLEIGEADLAWWKNAQVSDVTLKDDAGSPMVSIKSAEVTTPLWKLLWGGPKEIEFKIDQPEFHYTIDSYGQTNWDRVFPSASGENEEAGWPKLMHHSKPIRLKITNGRLTVHDRVADRTLVADQIEMAFEKSASLISGGLTAQTAVAQGESVENGPQAQGGIVLANYQLAMADGKVQGGDVKADLKKTPLTLIQPWLKHAIPHLKITSDDADGHLETKWSGNIQEGFKLELTGSMTCPNLKVTSSKWIPGKQLNFSTFNSTIGIDNTLPTSPGKYDILCKSDECRIITLPKQVESETQGELPVSQSVKVLEPASVKDWEFTSTGTIQVGASKVEVDAVKFQTADCRLDAKGTYDRTGVVPYLDVAGTGKGDLGPLLELFFPNFRERVDWKRLSPEEFAIKGEIGERPEAAKDQSEPRPLSAVATWKWDELESQGIQSQSGALWTKYEDSEIKIVPVDVIVGDRGKFVGIMHVYLGEEGRQLELERGPILENVAFTEEMCRTWLQYVSPVFANATDLEGQFSLDVDQFLIDLESGTPEQLVGELKIQTCRLGPGPAIQKVMLPFQNLRGVGNRKPAAGVFKDGTVWMELPPQTVSFARRGDRIYHDQLTFISGKVSIVSSGSVGIDRTLNLSLNVPLDLLPEKTGPLAQFLRNQPMRVQIRGTLDKPDVDATPLKEFGAGAVDNLLKGLLDKSRNRRN